jgi:hypothetical protein
MDRRQESGHGRAFSCFSANSVNATSLGQVFGCNADTVRKWIKRTGFDANFQRGSQMPKSKRESFRQFLAQDIQEHQEKEVKMQEQIQSENLESDIVQVQPLTIGQPSDGARMSSFSVCFSGAVDVNMIANSLQRILGPNASGEIEIRCKLD